MSDSPSSDIVKAARKTWEVRDELGRVIRGRALSVLDQARMFKAIGSVHSDNSAYVRLAMIAFSVSHIDGAPVSTPVNESGVDAAINRLGDEGYVAVQAMVESMIAERVAADAGTPEGLAVAKN